MELAFFGFGAADEAAPPEVKRECRPPYYIRKKPDLADLPWVQVLRGGQGFEERLARYLAAGYQIKAAGYASGSSSNSPMVVLERVDFNPEHCAEAPRPNAPAAQ